ncbi:MAG: AAA family ATPase [Planctomycetales bacterium]|nr:AAA family ATPase [Planctomycetales bacterium]
MTTRSATAARPFLAAPEPNRYFAAAAIEDARRRVARCIERREGAALVIGAAGTGKSLLTAVLAEQFASQMQVARLSGAQLCTRRALWQTLLFELGLPYRGMDEGELRLELQEHLNPREGRPRQLLLLVDEAHALPVRLLEELRGLTNICAAGASLVSVVLAGGPALEERFAEPQLEAFSQRTTTRCYLSPLERSETIQFVRAQLAAAGADPASVLADDAIAAMHEATGGVPRLINQLGDQLTWIAEETGMAPLDAAMVQQAWAELQQLPAPWDGRPAAPQGQSDVIEFGVLGGDDDFVGDPELDSAFEDQSPLVHEHEDEDEDDLASDSVASIPFTAIRDHRDRTAATVAADLDMAETLLASFDAITVTATGDEPAADEPSPPVTTGAEHPSAENPFAEPFDEEELLIDPYADFETSMLSGAQVVMNRLDTVFSRELPPALPAPGPELGEAANTATMILAEPDDELELVEEATELDEVDEVESAAATAESAGANGPRLSESAATPGELLVIDDDDQAAAEVVQARQFRRLFSCLESGLAAGM